MTAKIIFFLISVCIGLFGVSFMFFNVFDMKLLAQNIASACMAIFCIVSFFSGAFLCHQFDMNQLKESTYFFISYQGTKKDGKPVIGHKVFKQKCLENDDEYKALIDDIIKKEELIEPPIIFSLNKLFY